MAGVEQIHARFALRKTVAAAAAFRRAEQKNLVRTPDVPV